jgi:hypothetical protein
MPGFDIGRDTSQVFQEAFKDVSHFGEGEGVPDDPQCVEEGTR